MGPYIFDIGLDKNNEIVGLKVDIDVEGFHCLPFYWKLERYKDKYIIVNDTQEQ